MIGAMQSALAGIHANTQAFAQHSDRIARWGTGQDPAVRPEAELVGIMQSRYGIEANGAVLRASDEMLGTLLDVLA